MDEIADAEACMAWWNELSEAERRNAMWHARSKEVSEAWAYHKWVLWDETKGELGSTESALTAEFNGLLDPAKASQRSQDGHGMDQVKVF